MIQHCRQAVRDVHAAAAVAAAMRHLQSLGIARELTGRKRNKLYVFQHYLKILDEGTTPLR